MLLAPAVGQNRVAVVRGRSLGMARLLLTSGLVLVVAAFGVPTRTNAPARAASEVVGGRAQAVAPAVRGEQVRIRPLPPEPVCRRVAVIGDSLMDNARWYLSDALGQAGFSNMIDAHHSRRIPETVRPPYSGVIAAREVRSTWGDADCWVIALGSNDLLFGGGDPIVAASLIDSMLAAVTPQSRVWWVNLDYHHDPRTSFDFVGATSTFNRVLDTRASVDANLTVVDWYSLAEAHPEWFFDPVHVDGVGSNARAHQVVDAL
jgi:hypothetical protein